MSRAGRRPSGARVPCAGRERALRGCALSRDWSTDRRWAETGAGGGAKAGPVALWRLLWPRCSSRVCLSGAAAAARLALSEESPGRARPGEGAVGAEPVRGQQLLDARLAATGLLRPPHGAPGGQQVPTGPQDRLRLLRRHLPGYVAAPGQPRPPGPGRLPRPLPCPGSCLRPRALPPLPASSSRPLLRSLSARSLFTLPSPTRARPPRVGL